MKRNCRSCLQRGNDPRGATLDAALVSAAADAEEAALAKVTAPGVLDNPEWNTSLLAVANKQYFMVRGLPLVDREVDARVNVVVNAASVEHEVRVDKVCNRKRSTVHELIPHLLLSACAPVATNVVEVLHMEKAGRGALASAGDVLLNAALIRKARVGHVTEVLAKLGHKERIASIAALRVLRAADDVLGPNERRHCVVRHDADARLVHFSTSVGKARSAVELIALGSNVADAAGIAPVPRVRECGISCSLLLGRHGRLNCRAGAVANHGLCLTSAAEKLLDAASRVRLAVAGNPALLNAVNVPCELLIGDPHGVLANLRQRICVRLRASHFCGRKASPVGREAVRGGGCVVEPAHLCLVAKARYVAACGHKLKKGEKRLSIVKADLEGLVIDHRPRADIDSGLDDNVGLSKVILDRLKLAEGLAVALDAVVAVVEAETKSPPAHNLRVDAVDRDVSDCGCGKHRAQERKKSRTIRHFLKSP
eukprot:Opistho-2@28907